MARVRIERDTFGNIEVPADRLWGAQTQRSLINFRFPGETMPVEVVRAQIMVKRASARVNMALRLLDRKKGNAIVKAADEVLAGKHDDELLALDDALTRLQSTDPQAAQLVKLRFYAGLTMPDQNAEGLSMGA